MSESVDLSGFYFSDTQALNDIFNDIINNEPRSFAVELYYNYWTDWSGFITQVDLTYIMTKAEFDGLITMIDREEKNIYTLMESSMSDAEKFLVIHDYIVSNFDYDITYSNHDIVSFVEQRVGVCQAYSLFFKDAATRIGLECELVNSEVMYHEWNRVKIGNNWYHIDTTWDDPTTYYEGCYYGGISGRANHNYFLLDDTTIADSDHGDHRGWDTTEFTANDSSYVGRNWEGISSPFVYADGKWYTLGYDERQFGRDYFTFVRILEYDFQADEFTSLYTYFNQKRWYAYQAGGFWPGTYNGAFLYHGYMVFNLCDGIYTFDPSHPTAAPQLRYTCDTSLGYVYGCRLLGNNLEYCTTSDPNNGMMSPNYISNTVEMENIVSVYDGISYINMNAKCEADISEGDIYVYNYEDSRVNDFYVAVYDSSHRLIYADVRYGETMTENYPYTYSLSAEVSGGAYIKAFVFENTTLKPVLKAKEVGFIQ